MPNRSFHTRKLVHSCSYTDLVLLNHLAGIKIWWPSIVSVHLHMRTAIWSSRSLLLAPPSLSPSHYFFPHSLLHTHHQTPHPPSLLHHARSKSVSLCFWWRRFHEMELCTRSKGTLATKARWFSRFDAAKLLAQRRHYLMFLVDTALIMQRHNPYTHHINFADSLQ